MKSTRLYNKLYSRLQPFLFVKKSRCWVSFQLTSCNQIFMRCLVFEQDQVSKKWLQNYHKKNTQCCISLFHAYILMLHKSKLCSLFVNSLGNSRIPNKIEKHRRSNNFCHKAKLSCLAVGIMGKTFSTSTKQS